MPQSPRDEWITLDGLSFHYRNWGGAGQPIVLLHGLASTCHIWDLVAPILAENHTVVALDQRQPPGPGLPLHAPSVNRCTSGCWSAPSSLMCGIPKCR